MGYWHFCCEHSAAHIDEEGVLTPHPQPMLARVSLTWFSTTAFAERQWLGLSSRTLTCDRMERLYQVVPEDEHLVYPWEIMKRHLGEAYAPGIQYLEASRGTRPNVWAAALDPVRVVPILR